MLVFSFPLKYKNSFLKTTSADNQTWADYVTNAIDYDYIESNHDYNRDCICLETSWERKQNPFAWFDV